MFQHGGYCSAVDKVAYICLVGENWQRWAIRVQVGSNRLRVIHCIARLILGSAIIKVDEDGCRCLLLLSIECGGLHR